MANEVSAIQLVYPLQSEIANTIKGRKCVYVANLSLYFSVGDQDDIDAGSWKDSTPLLLQIGLLYFDSGTETITMEYTTDGINESSETIVTKGNTNKWKWVHFGLAGLPVFNTDFYIDTGDADFSISSGGNLFIAAVNLSEINGQMDASWEYSRGTHHVKKDIVSDNYKDTQDGWSLTREGEIQLFSDCGAITLDSKVPKITLGAATNYLTGTGYFVGKHSGVYKFHLGNPSGHVIYWDGSVLHFTGQVEGGTVAGWTVSATQLSADSGNAFINSSVPSIGFGATGYLTGTGFWVGKSSGVYKFSFGNPSGQYISWDGTSIKINIDAFPAKAIPVDADELLLADSAASFATKKVSWATVKSKASDESALRVWFGA